MNCLVKQAVIGCVVVLGLAVMPVSAQHEGHGGHGKMAMSPATALPKCPVTGEPINLAVSVPTDEGPVFFCCKDCVSKYQADPAKYATRVAVQRKALANRPEVQVTCPVSKEPVDQDVFIESHGKKVYFCCKGCINKYQADPAKYASALSNSYTYQTKCPVMGEDINPKAVTTTAQGMNIYFCCKGCDKKFFKDPQKYAPNLVAQGFTVNPKEMVHDTAEQAGHDHDSHDHDH